MPRWCYRSLHSHQRAHHSMNLSRGPAPVQLLAWRPRSPRQVLFRDKIGKLQRVFWPSHAEIDHIDTEDGQQDLLSPQLRFLPFKQKPDFARRQSPEIFLSQAQIINSDRPKIIPELLLAQFFSVAARGFMPVLGSMAAI